MYLVHSICYTMKVANSNCSGKRWNTVLKKKKAISH